MADVPDGKGHARCVSSTGRVTARRVLGKHLAFATLELERSGACMSGSLAPAAQPQHPPAAELKVCFAAETWDASSDAPFPARRSLLQNGSLVTVETLPEPAAAGAPDYKAAVVVRWVVHEHGGGRAAGRISTVRCATPATPAAGNTTSTARYWSV